MNSLDYLLSFQRFGIKLGLDNISYLLEKVGSPQSRFPAIHVTGTNGKGSVVAFVANVLSKMGYTVGRYISPHLLDFSERIVVNEVPIPAFRIDELVGNLRPIVSEMAEDPALGHPTFFEAVTAMAFQHFAQQKVDFAVVEVGMGGRYDSTNIVQSCLTVITNVHIEHRDYLGDTIEKIAFEKAGIIKQGVEVVSAVNRPEARRVIDSVVMERGTRAYFLGEDFFVESRRDVFPRQYLEFKTARTRLHNVEINLAGDFQAQNAAIALMCLDLLQDKKLVHVNEEALREGMAKTTWPARMEKLTDAPLVLLDVAHNPSAIQGLVSSLKDYFPGRGKLFVVGMLADKDALECLRILRTAGDTIIVTQPNYERALPARKLQKLADTVFDNVECAETIDAALGHALPLTAAEDMLVITGSLFNVAEVRDFFMKKPREENEKS